MKQATFGLFAAIANYFRSNDAPTVKRIDSNQTGGRSHGFKASPLLSRSNHRPNKYLPHQGSQEKARRLRQQAAGKAGL